jgi:hypothetical protein
MPLPEGYLPRKNDVLLLLGTVKHDVDPGETDVHLRVSGDWDTRIVKLEAVVGVRRRTWRESENVRIRNAPRIFGKIIAANDDYVWLALDEKSERTKGKAPTIIVHCNELEPHDGSAPTQPVKVDLLDARGASMVLSPAEVATIADMADFHADDPDAPLDQNAIESLRAKFSPHRRLPSGALPVPLGDTGLPGAPHATEAADLGEDDDGASPQENLGREDPSPVRP